MRAVPLRAPRASRPDRIDSATARLADQAFSRASGAPLVPGNRVRVLQDARENYPAMLDAIARARTSVHLEMYTIYCDEAGEPFGEALAERARAGVAVRVLYDWVGGLGKAPRRFWRGLRDAGVEVRVFNPPSLVSPLGWMYRDHRKLLVVDGRTAVVTGLCIGKAWLGDPDRGVEPWRDTGVLVEGPAVADLAAAFADAWTEAGDPLPAGEVPSRAELEQVGDTPLRVIAGTTYSTGTFRLDTMVAALARRRLWLADAYYAGTSTYVQALRAAARDGVDVRLLVPGSGTDIALVQLISRAGYRTLLEAGVRVFEWKGPMMHAKTAVADGHWARIGSTNLNLASWMGNWELDVVIEDDEVGGRMEAMYLDDLDHATEIVLVPRARRRVVRAAEPGHGGRRRGSAARVAAGALRVSNAVGAAIGNRRLLGPEEARLPALVGGVLIGIAVLGFYFPAAIAWPIIVLAAWIGLGLVGSGFALWREARRRTARRLGEGPPGSE